MLKAAIRYAYLMAAPRRTAKDLRWVATESEVAIGKAEEKLWYFQEGRGFLIAGAAAAALGSVGYAVASLTAPKEPAWGFLYEKEAVGEAPMLMEEFKPAVRRGNTNPH
mmetsp:Transcript_14296/g.42653  ORF Transcript_14296/g.42653 Transcript_14296/m.42653 type:complete len:109 (+) Transcript_14296:110-436(+)